MARDSTAGSCDVLIIGQGVIGLSTALALARRGRRVVCADALGAGHPVTSSAGASRSIRLAYADDEYVRLGLDAIARWQALEIDTGETILHLTGQLDLGPNQLLSNLESAMARTGVSVSRVGPRQLRSIFPELVLRRGEEALYHSQGGAVLAANAMGALAAEATRYGAELTAPERVVQLELDGANVVVNTTKRRIECGQAVVAAGPWTGELVAPLGVELPLTPAVAQVTYYAIPGFTQRPGIVDWTVDADGRGVYGHPVPGVGYKFGFDAAGREAWNPDARDWPTDRAEELALGYWLHRRFEGLAPPVLRSQRHPWTLSPDGHFVVDARGPFVLACGCSGHAFKFGPALGELVADITLGVSNGAGRLFSMSRNGLSLPAVGESSPITR